jgi:mannose-6-phosphate isomerase-like protein (cupin superfamily)
MLSATTPENAPRVDNLFRLDAHRLFSSPELEIVHIHLPPGAALVRHAAPVDTAFYVVTGTATIESDAGRVKARAGTLVPHPKETFHQVRNEASGRLEFLVIKAPRPAAPPRMDTQDH